MRIVYIGKHDSGGNDDEGAIRHALQDVLGHNVIRYHERLARRLANNDEPCDFVLLHKYQDYEVIKRIQAFKVFWYFDLVTYPDLTIRQRNWNRMSWMNTMTPLVDLGLCTDGDWLVNPENPNRHKLDLLRQGADVRFMGRGSARPCYDILFTGNRTGGVARESFCKEMEETYGHGYHEVRSGVHQRELANLIAASKIVVAPDMPVTDRYWSNRVYLCMGFQAFMLHPYCAELAAEYEEDREIIFYRGREDLHDKIQYYLAHPDEREAIAQAGYNRTAREHTYVERCKKLLQLVEAAKEKVKHG